MNWNRLSRAAAAFAAVATLVSFGFAQTDPLQKRVDLFLRDADLQGAIQALTLQTGLQFVVEPSKNEFNKISISLSQKTAEEAIDYICKAAGAHVRRDAAGVFIISGGPEPEAPKIENVSTAVSSPSIRKKIRLMRGDPEMVYSLITKAVAYDPENGYREIDRMTKARSDSNAIKLPGAQIINPGNQPATPLAFPKVNSQPNSESGNDITLPNESAAQQGGGGQLGGGGGGQLGGGGGQLGGQNGQGGSVSGLQGGQGLAPQGIDKVIYDPTDNSFIVTGTEEAIRELERLIEEFDQQPKQVVIKVEFVASTQKADRALGIDWLYARGTIFAGVQPGEFAASGNPIFLNYATGNISSRLRTLMNNGWGRTVSAPLVRTLNNQPAFVQQSVTTFIFIPIINNGPGGQQTVFQPVAVPVTTFLSVRPRINNNGTITMTLSPNIGTITGFSVGPDGTQLPNVTNQSIQLSTIVKNGETIALAGFTSKAENYTVKRIPVLSELPIIGQLFRSRNDTHESSELVVFVTPHIVEEDELGLQP